MEVFTGPAARTLGSWRRSAPWGSWEAWESWSHSPGAEAAVRGQGRVDRSSKCLLSYESLLLMGCQDRAASRNLCDTIGNRYLVFVSVPATELLEP